MSQLTPSFNGGERISREYYDDWMSGNSNTAIAVEKLFPDMSADEQTFLWKSKEEVYRQISTKMMPLPGLVAFLDACESKGLAMILVTNAPRLDAVHTLNVLGLSDRFAETMVIGYECARSKPHPDPYLEGLSRLGLSADSCVAFEDSVNGVSSAISAGLFTIGVGEGSEERLKRVLGAGICVSDYLDSRLADALLRTAIVDTE
ncbi:unnamed protein product [Hapterophycus canaliculatus]